MLHSVAILKLTGAAGLPLQQTDGRTVAVHILPELLHVRDDTLRERPVGVVGDIVHIRNATGLVNQVQRLTDILTVRAATSESRNPGLGIHLTDSLRSADKQIGIQGV